MRFPLQNQLDLPCVFEQLLPGRMHADGRRYLPVIVLRPSGAEAPDGLRLGVVDRHHRVPEEALGRAGRARLVCALSTLGLQTPPPRQGLEPEPGLRPGSPSLAPTVYARVLAVASWEVRSGELPFESLYAELLLDLGYGTIGLRTSLAATDLAEKLGKAQLERGDYVELGRSRIDILSFEA